MKLYQELYDLLSDKQRCQSVADIRENAKRIKIVGVIEKKFKMFLKHNILPKVNFILWI